MTEQWCSARVLGEAPGDLLPRVRAAALPVGAHVRATRGGTLLFFEGCQAEVFLFLQQLGGLLWVETDDSAVPDRSLALWRDGRCVYVESVGPDDCLRVSHDGAEETCAAARPTERVLAHAALAMKALAAEGIPVPVRRVWEGMPFPEDDATVDEVFVEAVRAVSDDDGEIPF